MNTEVKACTVCWGSGFQLNGQPCPFHCRPNAQVKPEKETVRMWDKPILIHGYRLQQTCSACPEQYDVFANDEIVAYFRLRHGTFRVDVPDCGGETIYTAHPEGDGIFMAHERVKYLTEAILAVQEYYINRMWDKNEDY